MILNELLISQSATIRVALEQLDKTGQGALVLVDGRGRFLRMITDGDMRRALLAGASLSDALMSLGVVSAFTLPHGSSESEAAELMGAEMIDQVPTVDADGIPTHLFVRRNIDRRIYLSAPHLSGEEMEFVEEAFRTNWVAPLGPNVDAFERELKDYVGVPHATALSSGTAGLHLALLLLGAGPGDLIFCSSLTFVASANPILYVGATPVFIDSSPDTWNMSPAALERAFRWADEFGKLPKAVVVVSLYGQSADLDAIAEICSRYQVDIIEDAAESLGATYKGKFSGTLGRIGVYSFNGNKIITTSGGGMLVAQDAALIERARFLATQARDPAPYYEHSVVGYNYRMSNVLAGIGRSQLKVLASRVAQRRVVFDRYRSLLGNVNGICWMPEADYGKATRWLTALQLDPSRTSARPSDVMNALAKSNIEARHIWKPMHRQPLFKGAKYFEHSAELSFSDEVFEHGVCLPSGSDLTEEEVSKICKIIRSVLEPRSSE